MEKKNINEVIAELSVEQLAGMIDHTFLKPVSYTHLTLPTKLEV